MQPTGPQFGPRSRGGSAVPPGPPVHHQWVAKPGDAAPLSTSAFVATCTDRFSLITMLAVVVSVTALCVTSGTAQPVVGWSIIFLILLGVRFISVRVRYGRTVAPGARWTLGFTPGSVVVTNPDGVRELAFTDIRATVSRGRVVFVMRRNPFTRGLLLPTDLIPAPALDHLRRSAGI